LRNTQPKRFADAVSDVADSEICATLTVLKQRRVIISHGRGMSHWNAAAVADATVQAKMQRPKLKTNIR
jgi:hypothetical protein